MSLAPVMQRSVSTVIFPSDSPRWQSASYRIALQPTQGAIAARSHWEIFHVRL